MSNPEKYSDVLIDWLWQMGYRRCFFVAGGAIMHLLNSVRTRMDCTPVVHEVTAGLAAEYFNVTSDGDKAFALVTAGPGLTQIMTAMAGAFLESRELLVIGGQVKTVDLATGGLRQRGIQEIDGVAMARPVCVAAERLDAPCDYAGIEALVRRGATGHKGPVFIEVPLDVQGAQVDRAALEARSVTGASAETPKDESPHIKQLADLLHRSRRPVLLIGGGVDRRAAWTLAGQLAALPFPLMTTWNGLDRIDGHAPNYAGRPDTWGQRAANLLLQQADLVIALGCRLGLQQTGFNWQQFAPLAKVALVTIEPAELNKGHPHIEFPLLADANPILAGLAAQSYPAAQYREWLEFCRETRAILPLRDPANVTAPGFICPYTFTETLSTLCGPEDIIVPCSSGGANSVTLQTFTAKLGQRVTCNRGLASMGYGLGGAIGAALANPGQRTILVEGDGGFCDNLQDVGTVTANKLNLKIFIYANNGYASIRTTQRNYFNGAWIGCDVATGLGIPDWQLLFAAYGISLITLTPDFVDDPAFIAAFNGPGAVAFLVPIDPEQTYWPKITSRITETGSMESNPLHRMSPDLPPDLAEKALRYMVTETVA